MNPWPPETCDRHAILASSGIGIRWVRTGHHLTRLMTPKFDGGVVPGLKNQRGTNSPQWRFLAYGEAETTKFAVGDPLAHKPAQHPERSSWNGNQQLSTVPAWSRDASQSSPSLVCAKADKGSSLLRPQRTSSVLQSWERGTLLFPIPRLSIRHGRPRDTSVRHALPRHPDDTHPKSRRLVR